ncbi:MAG: L,D-transpeptidase family protein [Porticoccaceae bacterium]
MRALSFAILLFSLISTAPVVQALTFRLDGNDVVGETLRVKTRYEDTFVGLGHIYGLGFRAMMNANPDVLPWVPGEGTEVILPLSFILPRHDGDHEAIILNLAEFRLYHFLPEKKMVRSYAVGIGREGWETPVTEGKVTAISKDPSWTPPESIRREHASYGDILPAVVAPGPDNPLGKYAVKLSIPGYLFHGTNKKIGFGMRVSHGCVRLYAGDIEELAMSVKPGVPVRIINEPVKAGWRKDKIYLEVHPQLEEDKGKPINYEMIIGEALAQRPGTVVNIDWEKVTQAAKRKSGMPTDISAD